MPREITVFWAYSASGPLNAQGHDVQGCVASISGVSVGPTDRVGTHMCPAHAERLPWDEIPLDGLTVCRVHDFLKHLTSVKVRNPGRKCQVITQGDGGIHTILEKRSEQANMLWLSARRSAQTSNAGPSHQPMVAQPDQYTDTGSLEGPGEAQSIAPSYQLSATGSASEQRTNGEPDPSQHQLPSFQDFMRRTFGPDPSKWEESR